MRREGDFPKAVVELGHLFYSEEEPFGSETQALGRGATKNQAIPQAQATNQPTNQLVAPGRGARQATK